MPWVIFLIWFTSLWAIPFHAVEMNGGFCSTPPTTAGTSTIPPVPSWNTGWGSNAVNAWDYIGEIGGASGTYLGNGWVLTAGHVGAGTFTLTTGPGKGSYNVVSGSGQNISNSAGTADLYLFRISSPPPLPNLIISTNLPNVSTVVVILGYGGGQGLTWGLNTVAYINEPITPIGYGYVSNDFFCNYDSTVTNGTYNSKLVVGDSGGGTFTFNTITGNWELTGINEVTGTYVGVTEPTFSGMVQLDTYAVQINALVFPYNNESGTSSPTMPWPALLILACLLFFYASRSLGTKTRLVKRG